MLNNQDVWIEEVTINGTDFWFVYDWYADITTDELYVFDSWDKATQFAIDNKCLFHFKGLEDEDE